MTSKPLGLHHETLFKTMEFLPEMTLKPFTGKCGCVPGNSSLSLRNPNTGADGGWRHLDNITIASLLLNPSSEDLIKVAPPGEGAMVPQLHISLSCIR